MNSPILISLHLTLSSPKTKITSLIFQEDPLPSTPQINFKFSTLPQKSSPSILSEGSPLKKLQALTYLFSPPTFIPIFLASRTKVLEATHRKIRSKTSHLLVPFTKVPKERGSFPLTLKNQLR